jgi:hypothetical protein
MHNFSQDVLKSGLWVVDANADDDWFCYFDWLTQFELTKKNHLNLSQRHGHSLFIDKKSLLADQLLIVDFDNIAPSRLVELWKSLGAPKTSVFNSRRDLRSYAVDAHSFFLVMDPA